MSQNQIQSTNKVPKQVELLGELAILLELFEISSVEKEIRDEIWRKRP